MPSSSFFDARISLRTYTGLLAFLMVLTLLPGCLSSSSDDDDDDQEESTAGEPSSLDVISVDAPVVADSQEAATVEVTVENTGDEESSENPVELHVQDTAIDKERTPAVPGGERKAVTFELDTQEFDTAQYDLQVDTGADSLFVRTLNLADHAGSVDDTETLSLADHRDAEGQVDKTLLRFDPHRDADEDQGLVVEGYQPEDQGDRIRIYGTDRNLDELLIDGDLEMLKISPSPEVVVGADPERSRLVVSAGEAFWSIKLKEVYGPPYDDPSFLEENRIEVVD